MFTRKCFNILYYSQLRRGKIFYNGILILNHYTVSKLSHFLRNVSLGKLALQAASEQFAELLLSSESLPKVHFIPERS